MKKSLMIFSLTAAVVGCSMMKSKSPVPSDFKKIDGALSFKPSTALKSKKIAAKKGKIKRSIASNDDLTPNGIRYRENGAKPETGKSGLRQIQSWGLRDKANNTTIYVTTGNIRTGSTEEGTHITKVQFKAMNAAGEVKINKEFNQLTNDGSYSFVNNQLTRSQKYTLMTHVSKDGEKRNFVVTTNNKVYLLPDLKAEKIEAPEQAFLNERIIINANIRELNGDIGANADCVLYINNAEAERAPGIWVDAGDTVSCQFARQFDSVGDKNLTVKVEGVSPTDYDDANNSISRVVKIVNNSLPLRTDWLAMYDFKTKYHYKYSNYWGDQGTINYDQDQQYAYYSGHISGRIGNGPWTMSVSESSGANTLTPFDGKQLTNCYDYNDSYWGYSYRQCWEYDYTNNIYASVYTYTYGSDSQTWVYYQRNWYRTVYYGATGSYSYYNGITEEYGTQQFPVSGSDWRIQVGLSADGSNYVADKTMTLQPLNYSYDQPWTCWGWYYYGDYCSEQNYSQTGKYVNQYIGE